MADHPHERRAPLAGDFGNARVLVDVLEQPQERRGLLADLPQELCPGVDAHGGGRAHVPLRGTSTGPPTSARSRRLSSVTSRYRSPR